MSKIYLEDHTLSLRNIYDNKVKELIVDLINKESQYYLTLLEDFQRLY